MLSAYLLLCILVFIINIVPAFMPATWMVLVYIYLQFHLPIIALIVLGAVFSTLGRIGLYYLSTTHIKKILPKVSQENMEVLGVYLNKRKNLTIPFIIFFAVLPLPSNVVFIGAGWAHFHLQTLVGGFFLGRLINYTLLLGSSGLLAFAIGHYVGKNFITGGTILLEVVGLVLLFFLTKINWPRILKKFL